LNKCFIYLAVFLLAGTSSIFGGSLDLTYHHTGVSFGDSKRVNGIRINFTEGEYFEKVNGLNLTMSSEIGASSYEFWRDGINEPFPSGIINGISMVLIQEGRDAREINGIAFRIVSTTPDSRINGIHLVPFFGKSEYVNGMQLGFIIEDTVKINGVQIGGFASTHIMNGVQIGGLHGSDQMRGLQIGILNIAFNLHGLQIGAINYAKNNPKFLRLLPIINMHF